MKTGKVYSGDFYRRIRIFLENVPEPATRLVKSRAVDEPSAELWERLSSAGDHAENVVEMLLSHLFRHGVVAWFHRSQHNDENDRRGIDFLGELCACYGNIRFAIDAKSSRRMVKKHQHIREATGKNFIFVPRRDASIAEEAQSLLKQILRQYRRREEKVDKRAEHGI